ncbi:MAG: 23S rRNA (pseudouridine(1915)-N(3))-methyltransferase RlmH [bacterium]
MQIRIIVAGLPKNRCIQNLTYDYIERIDHYSKISLEEIKPESIISGMEKLALKKEAKKFMLHMENSYNVVLDKDGEVLTSELFANFLNKRIIGGVKTMNIIIGGPTGIDFSVKQRADKVLSLSRMTFSHELSLLIIVEQIYRAFTIMYGLPYHK